MRRIKLWIYREREFFTVIPTLQVAFFKLLRGYYDCGVKVAKNDLRIKIKWLFWSLSLSVHI